MKTHAEEMTDKPKPNRDWLVYILLCSDNSLYTGITNNIEKRLAKHISGKGAKYFSGRKPEKVIYLESGHTHSEAAKREAEIKKMRRAGKDLLIESGMDYGKGNRERQPD